MFILNLLINCVKSKKNCLLIGIIFIFSNPVSGAVVWLVDPSATLEQEYDDNFFLASDSSNEEEVWTTTLTGELALRGKSDRLDLEALLRLDTVKYNGDDSFLSDRDNQFFGFSSNYKVSERDNFLFDASLNRDTIVRTGRAGDIVVDDVVGIEDSGDVDINLVDFDVRRTRIIINPSWRHSFSERSRGELEYRYSGREFSDEDGTGLTKFDRQTIISNFRYQLSERTTLTSRVSVAFFRPDDGVDTDTYEGRLGFIRRFSEKFWMDFSVGGRLSDFDGGNESSDSGFVARIGLNKSTALTNYRVNLERRVNPSASGNQIEQDRLNLDIRRAISETLNFDLNARVSQRDSTGSSGVNDDRELISIEPRISWQFSPSWNASLGYRYRFRDINDDPNGSSNSNSASLNFSYMPPRQF